MQCDLQGAVKVLSYTLRLEGGCTGWPFTSTETPCAFPIRTVSVRCALQVRSSPAVMNPWKTRSPSAEILIQDSSVARSTTVTGPVGRGVGWGSAGRGRGVVGLCAKGSL